MGRKQTGERKCFFLYLTFIIIILYISASSGCAFKTHYMLMETDDLITNGNYKLALEKDQQILTEYPQMGDAALFQMGLIYVNPDNPDKDYKKSDKYFNKLIKDYPDSNLKVKALIYSSLLFEITSQNKKNKELIAEKADLTEKIETLKKENQELSTLKKENQEKDKKIDELQQQIEKLKEIDLSIQKKKISVNRK